MSISLYECPTFWDGQCEMVVLRDPPDPNRYASVGQTYDRPHLSAMILRAIRAAERGDGDTTVVELELAHAMNPDVAIATAEHLLMKVTCRLAVYSPTGKPVGIIHELVEDPDLLAIDDEYPEHGVVHVGDVIADYDNGYVVRPIVVHHS